MAIALKSSYFAEQSETNPASVERVNILIVDDLPEKLLAYETILEELDQNLLTARSGEEALKLVLQKEFAVILLDVNMPGMDGFETAALIHQRKKSARTPIIFLTAFADEMRMAQGYASGAVDYLPMPVVPEILKAKVRVFIELSQMRQQAASQAKEHALRTMAEESARRSAFLVMASEVLARSLGHTQNQAGLLGALARLPLPYLADASVVWLTDQATHQRRIECAWTSASGDVHCESSASLSPEFEKMIQKAEITGQPQFFSKIHSAQLLPEKAIQSDSYLMESVLALPLTRQGKTHGMIVLMRKHTHYSLSDSALANDLASRASVTFENAMLMEEIREADQRKDEFLAMLAHELRNPLAPIFNALQVMRMSHDANLRKLTEETIERQLKHMIRLVDDLMDVSRISQGKIELCKERITLKDTFSHAVETAQPLIAQRGHILTVTLPQGPIWLNADAVRLSQIFSNLLNNAAKYTNNNGQIEVTAQQTAEWATITIRDNGIGISADMLERIFDMFSQVDSSLERSSGGLGIGLTLVKNLVEMHGGTIEAKSAGLHKGSEFIVRLPVIAAQEISPVKEQKPEKEKLPSLRILVVDDNEAAAKMLGWMVELSGHEIHLAHDGASAIEMARIYKPSVVLMDIGLPGMNGYDVCKAMHSEPSLKHTVFIAQTGWGQAEHRQRSKEAGFDYHLVKPVGMQTLQELLDNLLVVSELQATDSTSIH